MARVGGRYVSLELVPDEMLAKRRAVHARLVMAFEILGEEVKLPGGYGKPADPEKRELGVRLFSMFQRLLNEGCWCRVRRRGWRVDWKGSRGVCSC